MINPGQLISYEDLTAKDSRMYLKELFSIDEEDLCWKAMICLTGFHYLYPQIKCSRGNLVETIEEFCPDEFYFPSNSIVYSFVFLLYDKIHHHKWMNFSSTDSICYKNDYCQTNTWNFSTRSKENLRCFTIDQTVFSWKNFYEDITHLFSSCFLNSSSTESPNPQLYQCHQSPNKISIHRLTNKRKDCYFNDDENPTLDLCSSDTNPLIFRCLTNSSECDYRPWIKRTLPEIYRFDELCDSIINRHVFPLNANETNCEYWTYSCNSPYTNCNRKWNCPNGIDEFFCRSRSFHTVLQKVLRCTPNKHYCIQLIEQEMELSIVLVELMND